MNLNQYRREVYKSLPVKAAKAGIRTMLRKRNTLNVYHAVAGFKVEVGQVMKDLHHYVSGALQMKDDMKQSARASFGNVFYYAAVLGRELKVKMPSARKKEKLTGTITENLLLLDGIATDMLVETLSVFHSGVSDVEALRERFGLACTYLYGVTYSLYGEPPESLLNENAETLEMAPEQAEKAEAAPKVKATKAPASAGVLAAAKKMVAAKAVKKNVKETAKVS